MWVLIFELLGMDNDPYLYPIPDNTKEFALKFEKAFNLYMKQQWEEAIQAFTTLKQDNL